MAIGKADELIEALNQQSNPEKAKLLRRYFKTGVGEYAHGDQFIGLTVPQIRQISAKFKHLELDAVHDLLISPIHEHRFAGLVLLMYKFNHSSADTQAKIYQFYLDHLEFVNNWDLVDISAPKIVGQYLLSHQDLSILNDLSNSSNIWSKRVAIVATSAFIGLGNFKPTLSLAKKLNNDSHDLIHKAVGWMLREVGKKDQAALEDYLIIYASSMPRTMLRYAIEKLSPTKRQAYLNLKSSS